MTRALMLLLVLWIATGWPTSLSLGYLYARHWDGTRWTILFVSAILASAPFLALSWVYWIARTRLERQV
jgi:hypothetical protein